MTRTKLIVAASTSLSIVATTLILPILAPLIRQLHLSVLQGGLMLSIGSVVMVIAAPVWGALCDRYGRKVIMVAGFLGVLAGYGVYTLVVLAGLSGTLAVTTIFVALTASRALVGIFLSAVPASAQALMADVTTATDRASGMAIIGAASGVGLVAGPAISGALIAGGLIWPLYAAIALCGLGAVMVVILLKEERGAAIASPATKVSLFSASLRPWLFAGILLWVGIATVQISAGFYFQDRLGLDTTAAASMLSLALTLVGAAMVVVQFLQVKVLRLSPRSLVLAGAVGWIAGLLLLLSTADALSYYLAYGLLGLGSGFLMPGMMAGASLAVGHESQGAAAALSAAAQGVGFIIGPALSTALYAVNQTLPFWGLAGLMAGLALIFAIIPAGVLAPARTQDAVSMPLIARRP